MKSGSTPKSNVQASKLEKRNSSISSASTDDTQFTEMSNSEDEFQVVCGTLESMARRFLSLLDIPVTGESHQSTIVLLCRTMTMLQTCRYDNLDISSVLSMAAIHHNNLMNKMSKIRPAERMHIIIGQVYIAHCLVLDECCLLHHWHRHLFLGYCDIFSLNRAIERILKCMEYNLFVCPDIIAEGTRHIHNNPITNIISSPYITTQDI